MDNTDAYRTNALPQFRGATKMLRIKAMGRSIFRRAVGPNTLMNLAKHEEKK